MSEAEPFSLDVAQKAAIRANEEIARATDRFHAAQRELTTAQNEWLSAITAATAAMCWLRVCK